MTIEIQNEAMRAFYQHYLRQTSFYLIEMYSGRLRGGSKEYRQKFGPMSEAAHEAKGDHSLLTESEAVDNHDCGNGASQSRQEQPHQCPDERYRSRGQRSA